MSNLQKTLIISVIIHALILFPWVKKRIVVPRNDPGVKAKTLIVSIDKVTTGGIVKGFASSPGEQSETFLPDDSCAWSIEQQKGELEYDY